MALEIATIEATAASTDGKKVHIKTDHGILSLPADEAMRLVSLLLTACASAQTNAGASIRRAMPLSDIGLAQADQDRVQVSLLLDPAVPPLELVATSSSLVQWAHKILAWVEADHPRPSSGH